MPARNRKLSKKTGPSFPDSKNTLSDRICQEAARLLVDGEAESLLRAKKKALNHLGFPSDTPLPSNKEIENAVQSRQGLFHAQSHRNHLEKLRRTALEAMVFLQSFNPHLVGPILEGVILAEPELQLHIFAETLENVTHWLDQQHIPYQQTEKQLLFGGNRHKNIPILRFLADTVMIELYVFNQLGLREAPLDSINGRPLTRANGKAVQNLFNKLEISEIQGQ